jgi:hypothetical protein
MATKIGFKAQPLIDSGGVDWLSVGRDVVKTLTDQEKAREKTRQKGEQAYRDEIKRLGSVELGKDALANQWIMNTVDSITGTAGIDQKLWKSGALSTKDYLRNKANRKNGTDLVLQSYNTYNKNYNEVMEGIANGTLAKEKMLFLRAQAESMFDFEKTGVIVNPETSEVSVAKKDLVDGVYVMSENPNEFLNASELLQASSALYTAFDADKAASDLAKQTVLRAVGGTDIEQAYKALYNAPKGTQAKLEQARKDQVRAILNSEDAGAFLTDYLNEGFSFTKDSDEAATKNGEMSKMVLLNQDGSTSLTKEQLNYAVDKFDGILEAYLPKKQKFKTDTEGDISRKTTGKASGRIVTSLATMQAGKTLEERVLSASDIAGRDDTIIKIVETPDEILVTRQASTKGAQPVTTPYPRGEATLGFVKGAASGLTGVEDLNTALKNSSLTEGMVAAPITKTEVLFERTTPPKPPSGLVKFDAQLTSDFNPNILSKTTYEDSSIMGVLTPIATKYGVRISNPSTVSESLKFEIGEGNNVVDQTVELGETTKEGILNALKGFIKANKDATERFLALESETTGVDYTTK